MAENELEVGKCRRWETQRRQARVEQRNVRPPFQAHRP